MQIKYYSGFQVISILHEIGGDKMLETIERFAKEPSADVVQSQEPLTDVEQRIFLKAMEREEEVCKIVDEEYKNEGYKLNLVHACQEIIRKVKGVLWT